jgi:hypothetical protein
MSAPIKPKAEEETQQLLQSPGSSQGYFSSTYAWLQRATRGYFLLLTACVLVTIAAGVLLFPQKTWNRLMLQLFGCVDLNLHGHKFKLCENVDEPQHVQLF